MARKIRVLTDGEAAFADWVKAASTAVLECRTGRHFFPGITDERLSVSRRRNGGYELTAPCTREVDGENCGTTLRKILGPDGVLEWGTSTYEYDSRYPITDPQIELKNHNLTKAQRGLIRVELARRKEEARLAAEKLAAKQKRASRKATA
jgi:hypothetical protein